MDDKNTNERLIALESSIAHLSMEIKIIKDKISNSDSAINDDKWLSNPDVLKQLRISKRTLQTLRDTGKLKFSKSGGKIYYKQSDIKKYLELNYDSWRNRK